MEHCSTLFQGVASTSNNVGWLRLRELGAHYQLLSRFRRGRVWEQCSKVASSGLTLIGNVEPYNKLHLYKKKFKNSQRPPPSPWTQAAGWAWTPFQLPGADSAEDSSAPSLRPPCPHSAHARTPRSRPCAETRREVLARWAEMARQMRYFNGEEGVSRKW